jgi:hypothetical protein
MGGYAYAGDNPVADSDPTGLGAVGPPGSDCSTGTEYLTQCGGNGTSDTPAPGGGATGAATVTSSGVAGCNKFDCAYAADAWARMAPTPGGWKSLLAGVGCFFVGLGNMAVCAQPLACLGYKALGGEMPSASLLTLLCAENRCHAMRPGHIHGSGSAIDFAPGAWLSVGARAGGQ